MAGTLSIRPETRLMRSIGADLIKDYYAAVIELVKNAYDADSDKVTIEFQKNNQGANYHYLPKFDKMNQDYAIDFQNIHVISIGDQVKKEVGEEDNDFFLRYLRNRETFINNYERIASVSSPFIKDIIARFSAYYARQGQPNLL